MKKKFDITSRVIDNKINELLAVYSESVDETTIKYIDNSEWYEYGFIKWLVKLLMNTSRPQLEWLVWWCLQQDEPPISIERGKELLNFDTMNEMREWMNSNPPEVNQ